MDESDDASLWLAATRGTAEAFAVLFDRHRAAVYRKAFARLGNASDAEDIVAMVFLEAWRKRSKVRVVDGSIRPWLLATTTFMCLNQIRGRRRFRRALSQLPPYEPQGDHADVVADEMVAAERAAQFAAALGELSASEQALLDLSIGEELTRLRSLRCLIFLLGR